MLTRYHPELAEFYKKNWLIWLEGGETANQYQRLHLPDIAVYFWSIWDAPKERHTDPRSLTLTILDLVKNEIIELLVRMYILPKSQLQAIAVRRSRRIMAVSDGESVIEIVPTQNKKRKCRQDNTDQDPDGVDGDHVDESDPNSDAIKLFNLGALKTLWRKDDYEEVGCSEIALVNAHAGNDSSLTNMEILEYGAAHIVFLNTKPLPISASPLLSENSITLIGSNCGSMRSTLQNCFMWENINCYLSMLITETGIHRKNLPTKYLNLQVLGN